ncbi:hypothetical protein F4820DRAFT_381365 [Hypoxylon rubiginosum]|uniref:Uncharacterized protein n=1 Tax=Hypoxylon rubiginosum TaxID=110542 RepID=A0ACB9YW14_9PEZI|nr:hypothetical protein F4820DRAFT_381365 [Hypoxylon rubiginosum]
MAHLPEGWEADYDGTRWFYRFATTGLTQYHFPRPGDEYPELVGLGFGALDISLESKLASKHHEELQSPPHGDNSARVVSESGGDRPKQANESGNMSATGYFNPDDFMYFGLNDVSPVGDSKSEPALAELPESERIRSPVGFVAELANNDAVKCAEELAPIELDATQIISAELQNNFQQNRPAELSAQGSPVEQKQSAGRPVQDTTQHVEGYPLVSASFAYPPLKAAPKPEESVVQKTDSPPLLEQKVLASQQPIKDHTGENGYETWKPTQGTANEGSTNTNRKSIASSGISVLQSQNNDLGPMEQKRHSLSGPVDSIETNIPGILRPPSDPRIPPTSSTSPPKVESSPIPPVLQPATAPSKVPLPQDNSQKLPAQNGVPSLPGSGARHESISFSSGPPPVGSNSAQIPVMLKPAHDRQSLPPPQNRHLSQAQVDNVRPGARRINKKPTQPSSHTPLPPKIGGPGIYVFQEVPAAPRPTSGQGLFQDGSKRPHEHMVAQSNSDGREKQKFHQSSNQSHSISNESLSVVAPLNPQKPASPNKTSSSLNTSNGPKSNTQSFPASNPVNNSQPGTGQAQGKPAPHSTGSPSQEVNVYQSPQAIRPVSYQGLMMNSTLPQKPIRKPVLPQRPEKISYNTGTPMMGSNNIPSRPSHPVHQQTTPSTASARPTSVVQAQSHPASPQTNLGAHNQRPSISGSPSQAQQHASATHATSANSFAQGQPSISNTSTLPATAQRPTHGSPGVLQASNPVVFPGRVSSPPATVHAPISSPQNTTQRPQFQASPGQRPQNNQPATQGGGQVLNQNTTSGPPAKPQNSPSPITQPVSPLHSQVSSPAPSIASLHRPPSSASSLSSHVTAQTVMSQGPSTPHQNHPHAVRPTAIPVTHAQGNQQASQSPKPPVASPSRPFPMLPGQVTPLPSQVRPTSVPMSTQPIPTTQAQTQHLQNQPGQIRPSQQHPGSQPLPQTAMHRPPQQQPAQAHHMTNSGGSMPGQPMPGGAQQGQPRPHAHSAPVQQHTQAYPHSNMTSPGSYNHQGMSHPGQLPNGQPTVGFAQGIAVQGQVQMTLSSNTANPQTQAFLNNQQAGLGQGYQQYNQSPGAQTSPSQTFGQNKPFNSAQAAAALSDASKKMNVAGKKMKKWAKKTWQNPAIKQTTAAVGGAIIAESLGGDGVAGASIANQIYNVSQAQGTPQNNQPQRPQGLQHANTAPPQPNNTAGVSGQSQYTQAMGRPQLQQGMQPMGVQTPGRLAVVQNPGMIGGAANSSMVQQQPQMRPNMMTNQQTPQQISRPPAGRPPVAQPQQPGQPMYQGPPNQPVFQPRPVQTPYQARPGQPMYQMPPNQPNNQAQGGPDPYMAIGSILGNAVNTIAAGGRTNEASPATNQQQQSTTSSEPQHEYQSSQHQAVNSEASHEGQSEQHHEGQQEHHAEQSGQYNEGYHEQQYTSQPEQNHESYAEGNHTGQFEPHQEAHAEPHQETYAEQQQYAEYSEQQNTVYSNETGQAPSEQHNGAYSEPPREGENSYFATPPETTIINNNNTVINDVDNSNNAVANTTQSNYSYTDNSQTDNSYTDNTRTDNSYMDNTQANNSYTDNTQVMETNNMSTEATMYADTGYMDTSNSATADTTMCADATYTDMSYTDTTNMEMDMSANAEATAYADASYAVDSSYTDSSYADAAYGDATYVDVDMQVDVSVDVNETVYMEDQSAMMMEEESVSVDASAYVDVSGNTDYSGGDWGGGGEEW